MCELMGCIETGSVAEIVEIVGRFSGLPEFGMRDKITKIKAMAKTVEQIERELFRAKSSLRGEAVMLTGEVLKTWSAKDVFEATGYQAIPK